MHCVQHIENKFTIQLDPCNLVERKEINISMHCPEKSCNNVCSNNNLFLIVLILLILKQETSYC